MTSRKTPRRHFDTPLPTADQRMTPNRKARIVDAVAAGEMTFGQAMDRYNLSAAELVSWENRLENYGIAGLSQMRLQQYPEVQP